MVSFCFSFVLKEMQIDFSIHLASPSLLNKHRHFIDTGPDAAILFLTLSVMDRSPARLFICSGRARAETRDVRAVHTCGPSVCRRGGSSLTSTPRERLGVVACYLCAVELLDDSVANYSFPVERRHRDASTSVNSREM